MMKSCDGNAVNICPLERENVIFFQNDPVTRAAATAVQGQHCSEPGL